MRITIIRGLPGSGKSTFASGLGCYHIEADFFHVLDGKYQFNVEKTKAGNEWCKAAAESAMRLGFDLCVSNTFTQIWEMQPYIDLAKELGYTVDVVSMVKHYGSIHPVPAAVIEKMAARWEPYFGEAFV